MIMNKDTQKRSRLRRYGRLNEPFFIVGGGGGGSGTLRYMFLLQYSNIMAEHPNIHCIPSSSYLLLALCINY